MFTRCEIKSPSYHCPFKALNTHNCRPKNNFVFFGRAPSFLPSLLPPCCLSLCLEAMEPQWHICHRGWGLVAAPEPSPARPRCQRLARASQLGWAWHRHSHGIKQVSLPWGLFFPGRPSSASAPRASPWICSERGHICFSRKLLRVHRKILLLELETP